MMQTIKTIRLALPLNLGSVNCYLVEVGDGFILIDTGASNQRARLVKALEDAGCTPDSLKLIVLTHGDYDHTGSAAHLREKFGAKIAMHRDDLGMVERGDMFWNREKGNFLLRAVSALLFGFGKAERFTPDFYIEDGYDFSAHGFDAQAVAIPGHSKGSIGILTAEGGLFCGDLLENREKPAFNSIMDKPVTARASVEKLARLTVDTVYPGHGEPFSMGQFLQELG